MSSLIDKNNLTIRKGNWPQNEGINIDQKVIEDTIKGLTLEKCPVCATKLEHSDQFGTFMKPKGRETRVGYCPKENYIIELTAHQYSGNLWGTNFWMKIYTNAKYSKILANSGELADLENKHVSLR